MRIRSGGITIGTITKMISKASSTKALIAITESTTATATISPPGIDETILPTRSAVPSSRRIIVNVVAATSSENSAPVSAMASFSNLLSTAPPKRPVARPTVSSAKAPIAVLNVPFWLKNRDCAPTAVL